MLKLNAKTYSANPKICIQCDTLLPYEKRRNRFCSHRCSAIYNNTLKGFVSRSKNTAPCRNCQKLKTGFGPFCCHKCATDYRKVLKDREFEIILKEGGIPQPQSFRRFLIEKFNHQCSKCLNTEWNNQPIPLEVEHIDGNSDNNLEENLTVLCPNCHAQTPTYKARNKGNGRFARRQRYAEGKSF